MRSRIDIRNKEQQTKKNKETTTMAVFYLQKQNGGLVQEIRRSVKINGIVKYIIDRRGSINFVTQREFATVPSQYRLLRIQ